MAPFPYPSMSLSNPESPHTLNRCTPEVRNLLPFPPPPLAIIPLQSPPSHWPSHQTFGFPSNLAPTVSFSGVPFLTLPNSPNQSRQVLFQSWTSNHRHVLHPVLVTVYVPPAGPALVRLGSPVPPANHVLRVSSVPRVILVHRIVPSVMRESQAPASASPQL